MPINRIAHSSTEIDVENYIGILRAGQSISDTGWSIYADSAGVNPVDGLGGSPSITWSQNNISPLSGEVDLRLVKDANNRQGNGVSIPFTIANRHLAKVLQISFDAELISGNYESPIITPTNGTYTITSTTVCTVTANHSFVAGQIVNMTFIGGTRPVDGFYTIVSVTATAFVITVASGSATNATCSYTVPADLRISIIQDPTGTPVVIEPVNTGIQLGIANQRIRHIASFQTHLSITSYRLCVHVSNASTVAYTVDFANFKVWEPTQSVGSVITDWQSYTPIITGYSGTTFTTYFKWRRVGGSVEIVGSYVPSGGSSTTTVGTISIPFGLSANTSDNRDYIVGNGWRSTSNNTAFKNFSVLINTSAPTVLTLALSEYASTFNPFSDSTTLSNLTGLEEIGIQATVPIAGWGSSVAMSSDSGDGRVVTVQARNLSTNGTTGALVYTTVVRDTHNAYNTTTGVFTAPVSGDYHFSLVYAVAPGGSDTPQIFFNGSSTGLALPSAETAAYYRGGGYTTFLNTGQTIEFRRQGSGSSYSGTFHSISIHRISAGSQVVASVEGVSASYYSAATQTSLTTQINFGTRLYDTHGAVTTGVGAWKFTAPMSGKYNLAFRVGGSSNMHFQIYKNGLLFLPIARTEVSGYGTGTRGLDLLAGDFIDIRPNSSSTVNGNATASNLDASSLEISRIGN